VNWKERFVISEEVQSALDENRPVVALETSIVSHGMPYPSNIETALMAEKVVRENGAVPATIGVHRGYVTVGMTEDMIACFTNRKDHPETKTMKASVKGIPYAVINGLNAGFTIAAGVRVASMAGIHIMATGGLGGVSRGGQVTMDISADLEELGKTNVAVVCAGCKPILDIGRTKEVLETKDVPVISMGVDCFPAFFSRTSRFRTDYRIDAVEDVAKFLHAKWEIGFHGGVVVSNPIPEEFELDGDKLEEVILLAVEQAQVDGISGEDNTPYLLHKVSEYTKGTSLARNIEIVRSNVRVSALLAKAYCDQN